jgi:Fe-S cluster assembly scaffold protein SufB
MSGDFPKNAEEARLDRDTTREELTETLEALGHKLDVKARVSDGIDEKLDQATAKVADVTNEPTAVRFRQGADAVRAHPLPVFAGVLGLVILIRLILRRRNS